MKIYLIITYDSLSSKTTYKCYTDGKYASEEYENLINNRTYGQIHTLKDLVVKQ